MPSNTPLPEWIQQLKRIQSEIENERNSKIKKIKKMVKSLETGNSYKGSRTI
jgi:hypothetical protein